MKYKNYYKILGLKGPKASVDEVKTAYRKLAKKYHPDINPDNPEADEKFKDVNEAWQTLSENKKRKRYNIRYYLHTYENGIDIDLSGIRKSFTNFGTSEFAKIFIGEAIKKEQSPKADNSSSRSNLDENVNLSLTLEEAFNGATKQISYKPYGEPKRTVSVRVPRGSTNGSKIMLKGEGKKANFGTENGDLYINISIIENTLFKLDKIDLIKSVDITPAEAAIGCEKSIPSIDMNYKLKIPAGTQQGEVISIKDAGFISKDGKRGDLRAVINIEVPKELSEAEKELYTKLKELRD